MKNTQKQWIKRFMSCVLVFLMVFTLLPTAQAAGNGSITITASGTGDKEVNPGTRDFVAYKILDFQQGQTAKTGVYTVPDVLFQAYHDFFTTAKDATPHPGLGLDPTNVPNTAGPNFDKFVQDTLGGLTEAQRRDFVAFMMPKVEASGIPGIALEKDATKKIAHKEGLDLGFYIIKDTTDIGEKESRALVSLTTTEPAASVEIKAGKTPGEKKIVENGKEVDQNTAAIGDTVNYRYKTNVSSQLDHFKRYSFEFEDDLCKGLDLVDENNKGFTIQIGTVKLNRATSNAFTDGDYFVTTTKKADGTTSVSITFKDLKTITGVKASDAITIEYAAKVNKDATPAATGNPNTARVKYSNDPNKDDGGTPEGIVPDSTVKTYLTEIELFKFHKNGDVEDPLAGAEFELKGEGLNLSVVTYNKFVVDNTNGTYWKLTNGTYTTTDPSGQGVDKSVYEDVNTKYKVEKTTEVLQGGSTSTNIKATTGPDGKIKFTGLKPGTYTLTETKAPYGYNKLADPITIKIGVKLPGEKDDDGVTTLTEPKWSYTTVISDVDSELFEGATIKIENKQGTTIPGLGGAGTTTLYALASTVAVVAAIYIVSKKRAEQKN